MKSNKRKVHLMKLFMAMDYNDDGYIEEQEWLALKELNLKKLMK